MSDRSVEFFGESFRLAERADYEFATMEFASVADDLDTDSMAGAAAVMHLLQAVVHADDVKRFMRTARANRAQVERDLMPLIVAAFEEDTGRPTGQPADSSDGLPTTSEPSADGSSLRVIRRLEERGRPDLALMVDQAQRSRVSA